MSPETSPSPTSASAAAPLAVVAILVLAAWAIAAPYADSALGLDVNVRPVIEVVDHVVPGVVCILAALLWAAWAAAALPAALVITLSGFWMTATHLPLVLQARREGLSFAAPIWHTAPGVCLLLLGAALTVAALRSGDET